MLRTTYSKLIIKSTILVQKKHLSNLNEKYIKLFGQNIDEKNLAFWTGFIVSSVVPLNFIISGITHLHTEHHMLKNIEKIQHLPLNLQQPFAKESIHKNYFLFHNGANGMFFGSLFYTVLGVSMFGIVGLRRCE
jgi:hypothetical protein